MGKFGSHSEVMSFSVMPEHHGRVLKCRISGGKAENFCNIPVDAGIAMVSKEHDTKMQKVYRDFFGEVAPFMMVDDEKQRESSARWLGTCEIGRIVRAPTYRNSSKLYQDSLICRASLS